MSPMRIRTGVAALIASVATLLALAASMTEGRDLLPVPILRLLLTTGAICWISHGVIACRDQIFDRLDDHHRRLCELVADYGDGRATAGVQAGMRMSQRGGISLVE